MSGQRRDLHCISLTAIGGKSTPGAFDYAKAVKQKPRNNKDLWVCMDMEW